MKQPTLAITRRAAAAGALALLASGCFGEFAATRALYKWNSEVSPNKWLRWLVFLVLAILPVYGLFVLADAIVINTIEFFSGKNPVSNRADLGHGNSVTSSRTADPNLIRHEHRHYGKLVRVLYVRRVSDHELCVLDEHFVVLTRVRLGARGEIITYDSDGRELSSLSPDAVNRIGLLLESGASASQSVQLELAREANVAHASEST
jgi:hypothetical protein